MAVRLKSSELYAVSRSWLSSWYLVGCKAAHWGHVVELVSGGRDPISPLLGGPASQNRGRGKPKHL
jgi:hypothetical protein